MQILQRLFNIPTPEPTRIVSNSTPIPRKQGNKDQSSKSKDIVVLPAGGRRQYKRVESSKLKCEDLSLFRFLQRKDVSKPFFYHTLNLRRFGSFGRRRQSAKMTKEEDVPRLEASKKHESATHHVGNKVLPISDSAQSSEKKEKTKGDKNRAISRMRDLIKWAAFTRGGKYRLGRKVLNLKNQGGVKTVGDDDDDEFSNDSPKISFRWEVESCSTTSSVYSKPSSAFKTDQIHVRNHCIDGIYGSWITTDSEFVVLEL